MDYQHQLKLAQDYERQQANEKLQLAIKLGTRAGFFTFYFECLPKYQTQNECFNAINHLHHTIFKEYKYTDYNSFRKQMKPYLKAKK